MVLRWQTEHNKLAELEFAKILKELEKQNKSTKSLPPVSSDILEFIQKFKPMSEGNLRDLQAVPFWTEIYKDDHPFKMIVGGRQIYKSTYVTDVLTHEAITRPGAQLGYVTFKMSSLANFSKQKLRSSFVQNPSLMQYLGRTSNINEHPFKNGSVIHCTTSVDGYKNIEGKSLHHVILDEAQYQPMHLAQKVMQTIIATKGKITICGIGGESGSAYENYWNKSTQSKWISGEPEWRKKLQYDENIVIYKAKYRSGTYADSDYTGDDSIFASQSNAKTAAEISANPEKYLCALGYFQFTSLIDMKPKSGMPYIHSASEPYNEEQVLSQERVDNWIDHFGMKKYQIHCSGHAKGQDLFDVVKEIDAKILYPIHTEHPTEYVRITNKMVIVEEGKKYTI